MKGYKKKVKETTEWEDSLIKHKVGKLKFVFFYFQKKKICFLFF